MGLYKQASFKQTMSNSDDWQKFWAERAAEAVSDFDFDHHTSPRQKEIDTLSNQELVEFIDPKPSETVFDAGCGSGANIVLLHSQVHRLIGMDYISDAIARSQRNIQSNKIENADVITGNLTDIPLPGCSVDKVLCLSVFQYLNDNEVHRVLSEFVRILRPGGVIIIHVKNLASLYLSTLWTIKALMSVLGMNRKPVHLRSYRWYVRELRTLGFEVVDFNSFNLFTIERMPTRIVFFLQKFELRHHRNAFWRNRLIRRSGADLKIKAKLVSGNPGSRTKASLSGAA